MNEENRLDMLFYELASEDRLAILNELCDSSLKMQEVARKLDLTATEATRQLQRMTQAKLISRGSEGAYQTTLLGKLLLTLAESMNFVYKHDDYFLTHDVSRLPLPFVRRLAELSQGELRPNLNDNLARWETLIKQAEDHVWVMTPEAMEHLSRNMAQKLLEGVKLRSILCENIREAKTNLPSGKNVERKTLPTVSFIIMISEKEASISFPHADGTVDFQSFFGKDPVFKKWVNDLFISFWEQAKIWYSQSLESKEA